MNLAQENIRTVGIQPNHASEFESGLEMWKQEEIYSTYVEQLATLSMLLWKFCITVRSRVNPFKVWEVHSWPLGVHGGV